VGIGLALFAEDLIRYVFGADWLLAVTMLQVLGVTAAVDQIGFNWTAYARARAETRPMAISAGVFMVVMIASGIPLVQSEGVNGYAIALAAATAATMAVRLTYLVRLFPAFRLLSHISRAIVPTIPAALLVLAGRAVIGGHRGPGRAVAEAAAFLAVVAVGTLLTERALLREAIGYLRRRAATAPAP
jgi:O-antigen/teichoic acid export membrane protein